VAGEEIIVYPVIVPLGAVHEIIAEIEVLETAVTFVGGPGGRLIELEGDENGPDPDILVAETVNV
jgi:hypothetical protein